MKALVTGGAGFIGSNLAVRLLHEGHDVTILDNLSTGKKANVPSGVKFINGDVRDAQTVGSAARDQDWIFHEAALGSVPRSLEDPLTSNQVNVDGTLNVLEAARRHDAKKVVFASSSSVYGDTPTLPKVETMATHPMSPYAVTKLAGESYCRAYFSSYGIRTTALRYFNVFGPRQDPNGAYAAVIPRFCMAALAGQPLTILGDGLQSRDFTFVEDVVSANIACTQASSSNGLAINVGSGHSTSLMELAKQICALTGSRSPIVHMAPRPGDVRDSLASLALARDAFGYDCKWTLSKGLHATIASMRAPE